MTVEASVVAAFIGKGLFDLSQAHSEWSQATFGSDVAVGPVGPLRHLRKEAEEAENAAIAVRWASQNSGSQDYEIEQGKLKLELADCLLLLLDANRRAGFSVLELIEAGRQKLEINKTREWKRKGVDQPIEHVKDE